MNFLFNLTINTYSIIIISIIYIQLIKKTERKDLAHKHITRLN